MKIVYSVFFAVAGLAMMCILGAWYQGYIPIFGAGDEARLRKVLNLAVLPAGTTITESGLVSWPGSVTVFEVEATLSPGAFERLLKGRQFKDEWYPAFPVTTSSTRVIEGYRGFHATEIWTWSDPDDALRRGDKGEGCAVYCNATRDRVFVRHTKY